MKMCSRTISSAALASTSSPAPFILQPTTAEGITTQLVKQALGSQCAFEMAVQLPEAHGAEGTYKIKTQPPKASRFVSNAQCPRLYNAQHVPRFIISASSIDSAARIMAVT